MPPEQLEALIEEVSPSIVSIYTMKIARSSFLQPVPVSGAGSGFVFDKRGYIITNHHVIEGMDRAKMVLPIQEKEIGGKVVGSDPKNDLAVIKANTTADLEPLEFGDSSNINAGQSVIAIGNALGLKGAPTVSHGIISAPDRTIRSRQKIMEHLIQTDAAINPGNSGGPLINIKGKVIGVNTAMVPRAQGMSFAIPSNIAKKVSQQLIDYGKVKQPWLGVHLLDFSPHITHETASHVEHGALVVQTSMGSPASQAGILRGDIIRTIEGIEITNSRDVKDVLSSKEMGEEVEVTILRQGKQHKMNVLLKEYPKRN